MAEYNLLQAQCEFLNVPHNHGLDVCLYQGGYGSGKTFSGSLLGFLLSQKYPGCRGLVTAQTYPLLRDTTQTQYFEHLDNFNLVRDRDYKFIKSENKIIFANGSEILFRSAEDPTKLKSLNLSWVEIEEMSDTPESTFNMLLGRLRQELKPEWQGFKYRLFGHTNPEPNKGWIYKTFVEKPKDNYRLIIAPTTQNKYLPDSYIESMKQAYDEEYYKINVLGEFGDYSKGLVVKGFTDEHIREINYQSDLNLHITCDFNVDPMAWILAHKTDDKVFYFDEIVIENTNTVACVEEFLNRYPNHKGKIIINGDASGNNRSVASEYTNYVQMKNRLLEHGYRDIDIRLRAFNPPIKNRIAAFNAKIRNANGEVGIYVHPRCKWFIYNLQNLKYKEGTSIVDVPTHNQIKQDRNAKFLEHPFDAGSYLVEYYFPIMQILQDKESEKTSNIPRKENFNHIYKK